MFEITLRHSNVNLYLHDGISRLEAKQAIAKAIGMAMREEMSLHVITSGFSPERDLLMASFEMRPHMLGRYVPIEENNLF